MVATFVVSFDSHLGTFIFFVIGSLAVDFLQFSSKLTKCGCFSRVVIENQWVVCCWFADPLGSVTETRDGLSRLCVEWLVVVVLSTFLILCAHFDSSGHKIQCQKIQNSLTLRLSVVRLSVNVSDSANSSNSLTRTWHQIRPFILILVHTALQRRHDVLSCSLNSWHLFLCSNRWKIERNCSF